MARTPFVNRNLRFPMSDKNRDILLKSLNDTQLALQAAMGTDGVASPTETITSGALTPSIGLTKLSVTGTVAYTLAAGTYVGQVKQIRCTVAASTPNGTITIATMVDGASHTLTFSALQQYAELIWNGTGWDLANLNGAVLA